ncbi:PepSY-associated TM helix domain-containing protein [Emcibacter sp.]|uniref:PepSY-associated TM helix domain-containing protein n=1 Tax=Emcibacter sp. TaxID=1979954 RepID=UPI003A8DD926
MNKKSPNLLTPDFVKKSLSAHLLLGLIASGLLYVVSVSGTLAVLYPDLERWEQPNIQEFTDYEPAVLDQAVRTLLGKIAEEKNSTIQADHMHVVPPTQSFPRVSVSADLGDGEDIEWYANQSGDLQEPVAHDWTHFLLNLHIYLNLPGVFGLTLVGLLGVMMGSLIITGFLAHPRIFRDAFRLKWSGSSQIREADLHNRLSVWGSPFHIIFAVTGAYFGLASLLLYATTALLYDGDQKALTNPLFVDYEIENKTPAEIGSLGAVWNTLTAASPDAIPYFVNFDHPGTEGQMFSIYAKFNDRLIYGERFDFNGQGSLIGTQGLSDGPVGKQIFASVYPLHFGSFGGLPVRLTYVLLGLALCVVCAGGMKIWLIKKRQKGQAVPLVERLWTATVWGTPALLALTALLSLWTSLPLVALFWGGAILLLIGSMVWGDAEKWRTGLLYACFLLLLATLASHLVLFGADAFGPAALTVNSLIIISFICLGLMLVKKTRFRQMENVSSVGQG